MTDRERYPEERLGPDDQQDDECGYCGRTVPASDAVPQADDDAAWAALLRHHADDCDWITTRAHRHMGR